MGFPSCSNLPEAEVGHLQATSLESRASIQHLIPGRDAFEISVEFLLNIQRKNRSDWKKEEGGWLTVNFTWFHQNELKESHVVELPMLG